jgi:hypothetical protein
MGNNKTAAQNWMSFFKASDRAYFELHYVHLTRLNTSEIFGKLTSPTIRILKTLGLTNGKN